MPVSNLTKPQAESEPTQAIDGRTLRANNSRQKIVDAMLSLVRAGDISPSAESVATTANVGLRTVFRRFSEMEILYREMIIDLKCLFRLSPKNGKSK